MSTTTPNLGLIKQTGSENYSIDVVNGNLDLIDTKCVNIAGAQTISGAKTFTTMPIGNKVGWGYLDDRLPTNRNNYGSATGIVMPIHIHAVNQIGNPIAGIDFEETTSSRSIGFRLYGANGVGWKRAIMVNDSSGMYVAMPTRDYSSSHTDDVVTIGTLQASTDVVHRSGDETINGTKTFEYVIHKEFVTKDSATVGANTWRRLYNIATSSSGSNRHVTIEMPNTRNTSCAILDIMWGGLTGSPWVTVMHRGASIEIRVCRATDGHLEVWTNDHVYGYVTFEGIRTAGQVNIVTAALSTADTTEPVVGDTYSAVVTPEVI